jgi:hypothetical protein
MLKKRDIAAEEAVMETQARAQHVEESFYFLFRMAKTISCCSDASFGKEES